MVIARHSCPRGPAQRLGQRRARAQLPGVGHRPRHRSAPGQRGRSSRRPGSAKRGEQGRETKHVIKNILWTTSKNFTVERGQQQIEELISTWDIHESWLHHSEFLEEEELKDSKRYHYRACWGLPTRRKPVPRATANVYFVITAPVEVFYRLESSRLIRRPEQCQFREKWLQDIIENKITHSFHAAVSVGENTGYVSMGRGMFLKITLENKEHLVLYIFPNLPKATLSFELEPTPLTSTYPSQGTSCKQQQQILSHSSFPFSKKLCKPNKIPSELESEELLLDFASSSS
ncbi:A-kinase anchor protein 14, partial [Lamprotornis superbus]